MQHALLICILYVLVQRVMASWASWAALLLVGCDASVQAVIARFCGRVCEQETSLFAMLDERIDERPQRCRRRILAPLQFALPTRSQLGGRCPSARTRWSCTRSKRCPSARRAAFLGTPFYRCGFDRAHEEDHRVSAHPIITVKAVISESWYRLVMFWGCFL